MSARMAAALCCERCAYDWDFRVWFRQLRKENDDDDDDDEGFDDACRDSCECSSARMRSLE